jgi:hypothetical protein
MSSSPMGPQSNSFQIIGLTRDELRRYALTEQLLHDPSKQDHGYDRCEHCHYTRHPCSVHDLATAVLQLLDQGASDEYFT